MAIANITNNILTDSGVATSALQIALNGTGFVKISGTTISYDNSTYALDSAVVKLTGTQTVGGAKTFSTYSKFDGGVILKNNVSASLAGYVGLSAYSASGNKGINIDFDTYSASFYFSGILPYQYTFPAATGTLALTSDLSSYLPLTGGTLTGALGIGVSPSYKLHLLGGNEVGSRFIVTGTYAPIQFSGDNSTTLGGINAYGGNVVIGGGTSTGVNSSLSISASTGAATFSNSFTTSDTSALFLSPSLGTNQTVFLQLGKNIADTYNSGEMSFKFVASGSSSNMVSLGFYGAGQKLNVLGNGNVGIGTSTTTGILTLGKAGGGQYIAGLDNTTGYEIGYMQFNTDNITINPQGGASGNSGFIRLLTSNVERMRITSGGDIEIASGSIKTGTPSGGTAKPWKLGQDTSTLYSATRTIQVEIDGGTYYLLAVKSTDL